MVWVREQRLRVEGALHATPALKPPEAKNARVRRRLHPAGQADCISDPVSGHHLVDSRADYLSPDGHARSRDGEEDHILILEHDVRVECSRVEELVEIHLDDQLIAPAQRHLAQRSLGRSPASGIDDVEQVGLRLHRVASGPPGRPGDEDRDRPRLDEIGRKADVL